MKIMKYLCSWIGIVVIACNSDFLDTRPTSQLDQKTALSTQENIYAALNGIHRMMVAQYLTNQACGGEPSMCIIRDCLGEDLVHPNTANSYYLNMLRWTDHRNEESVLDKYPFVFYYNLILQSNLILEAVDKVAVTDSVQIAGIRGEALCFRAWAHFQLLQLYGQRYENGRSNDGPGITCRRKAVTMPLRRSSVEECYHFILDDLGKAISCLQEYIPVDVTHFSLKVAYGLKARVLLTRQDYPAAAEMAGKAIRIAEAQGFRLMRQEECLGGFSKIISRAQEALWAANTLEDQTIAFYSFYAYMSWNFNSTAIRNTPRCINSRLYQQIAPTDVRSAWWDPTGEKEGPASAYARAKYQNRKFEVENTTVSAGDFAYMRLAELYLIRAEALARCGQEKEARQVLYQFVITRDPAYVLSVNSGEALAAEIMIQRRIELWGEGFRFSDLKRLNLPLDRRDSNHLTSVCSVMRIEPDDPAWQWLIPAEEVKASLGLVEQNE